MGPVLASLSSGQHSSLHGVPSQEVVSRRFMGFSILLIHRSLANTRRRGLAMAETASQPARESLPRSDRRQR